MRFCSTCRNEAICRRHHEGDIVTGKNGCFYDPSMHYPIASNQLIDKLAVYGEWWFWCLEVETAKIKVNKLQFVDDQEYIDDNQGNTVPMDDTKYKIIEPVQEPGFQGIGVENAKLP